MRVGRTLIIGGIPLCAEDVVQARGHIRSGTSRWGQSKASTRRRDGGGLYITSHAVGNISRMRLRESGIKFITWCVMWRDCARIQYFFASVGMHQVIVSASGPVSGSPSSSFLFHDISTGSSLASFKQSTPAKNGTALIGTTAAQGGLILAVQPDKALLNVYSFQKVLLHFRSLSICDLTFLVLRINSPSKSSSQNVFPA